MGRIGYLRELEDVYQLGFGIHASPLDSTKTQINTACAAINIDKQKIENDKENTENRYSNIAKCRKVIKKSIFRHFYLHI